MVVELLVGADVGEDLPAGTIVGGAAHTRGFVFVEAAAMAYLSGSIEPLGISAGPVREYPGGMVAINAAVEGIDSVVIEPVIVTAATRRTSRRAIFVGKVISHHPQLGSCLSLGGPAPVEAAIVFHPESQLGRHRLGGLPESADELGHRVLSPADPGFPGGVFPVDLSGSVKASFRLELFEREAVEARPVGARAGPPHDEVRDIEPDAVGAIGGDPLHQSDGPLPDIWAGGSYPDILSAWLHPEGRLAVADYWLAPDTHLDCFGVLGEEGLLTWVELAVSVLVRARSLDLQGGDVDDDLQVRVLLSQQGQVRIEHARGHINIRQAVDMKQHHADAVSLHRWKVLDPFRGGDAGGAQPVHSFPDSIVGHEHATGQEQEESTKERYLQHKPNLPCAN